MLVLNPELGSLCVTGQCCMRLAGSEKRSALGPKVLPTQTPQLLQLDQSPLTTSGHVHVIVSRPHPPGQTSFSFKLCFYSFFSIERKIFIYIILFIYLFIYCLFIHNLFMMTIYTWIFIFWYHIWYIFQLRFYCFCLFVCFRLKHHKKFCLNFSVAGNSQ